MTASAEEGAAADSPRTPFPDFFIVGHAKCGSTALYEMLRRHPQVFMPSTKEPQYFARNTSPPQGDAAARAFLQTGRTPMSEEEYLELFAPAAPGQIVGEASTFYLWSPVAPARIKAAQPRARIVGILREPASFLHSLHLQMVQNLVEDERDLRRALELEDERRRGLSIPKGAHWPAALIYSDRVRYVEQLRRYETVFPDEQLLFLIYDDFRSDNEATVRRVLRFLGADDAVDLKAVQANPTVAVRNLALSRATRSLRAGRTPLSRAARSAYRGLTPQAVRSRLLTPARQRLLYSAPPAADPQLAAELRERFRGEVDALSEHLGRDLIALWGYDR